MISRSIEHWRSLPHLRISECAEIAGERVKGGVMRYWLAVLVVAVAGCSRTVQTGPRPGVYWKEVGSSTCMEMPFGKAICWGDAKLLMPTWTDEAGDLADPEDVDSVSI